MTNGNYRGSIPIKGEFLFENFAVSTLPEFLADGGGGVNSSLTPSHVFGATKEGIGEGGVLPAYTSNGEGMLLSHDFVGALLALAVEVAIGELVMVEALLNAAVWSMIGGERVSNVYFIGGEAGGSASGVVIGVFDAG